LNNGREPFAEVVAVAAVEFYLAVELVDLDAEAVELNLVSPIVAGSHALGQDRATGLDELKAHAQILDEP
jgi:hypothetical protein